MKGFGLDYDTLAAIKPDLVMMSACLNGQTGPHKDYPGFGGQGSALAGYNALTGWPDREPVGPYGTITDSLAPRYVAAALAAGLHYRRRTGHGVYLDVSQVESAIWTLAPWLLDYEVDGVIRLRDGNDHRDALPARRVRVRRRGRRRRPLGRDRVLDRRRARPRCARSRATTSRRGPRTRRRSEVADAAPGGRHRGGAGAGLRRPARRSAARAPRALRDRTPTRSSVPGLYERNGFRLAACPGGYDRAGPTLGQDNDWVLGEVLGLTRIRDRRIAGDRRGRVS